MAFQLIPLCEIITTALLRHYQTSTNASRAGLVRCAAAVCGKGLLALRSWRKANYYKLPIHTYTVAFINKKYCN